MSIEKNCSCGMAGRDINDHKMGCEILANIKENPELALGFILSKFILEEDIDSFLDILDNHNLKFIYMEGLKGNKDFDAIKLEMLTNVMLKHPNKEGIRAICANYLGDDFQKFVASQKKH